jgi:hypothetical protein
VAATQEEREPVHERAVYLYFAVLQIFEAAFGERIPEVGMDAVELRADGNEAALERLESAREGFVVSAAEVAEAPQPAVLRYVVEALFERSDDDPDAALEGDEAGFVFLILKTVVDLLDEAVSGAD